MELKINTKEILSSLKTQPLLSIRLKTVVEILLIYNSRISEILNLKYDGIYPDKYIILPGAKHSKDVIIRDREILRSVQNLKANGSNFVFYPVNYYQVYHYLKKNYSHLFKNILIKKNAKVTHAFRYLNVSTLGNDKLITEVLHHNSNRSAIFYKNKLRLIK